MSISDTTQPKLCSLRGRDTTLGPDCRTAGSVQIKHEQPSQQHMSFNTLYTLFALASYHGSKASPRLGNHVQPRVRVMILQRFEDIDLGDS